MKIATLVAAFVVAIFPTFTSAQDSVLTNLGNFLGGQECRVPIYHTEFAFPPEGGQIVQDGNQLYFVRNYLPGCENAGAIGVPVSSHSVNQFPQKTSAVTTEVAVPRYVAPNTGCAN